MKNGGQAGHGVKVWKSNREIRRARTVYSKSYRERRTVVRSFLLSQTHGTQFNGSVLPQSIWMEKEKNNTNVRLYCA